MYRMKMYETNANENILHNTSNIIETVAMKILLQQEQKIQKNIHIYIYK